MKKIIIMLLALLTISLSACSQKKTETNMKQKVLVVYFSATGTTKDAAQQLAEVTGADLHEIKPEQPYTFSFAVENACCAVASASVGAGPVPARLPARANVLEDGCL